MQILFSNYRYFISGGPERYMFNITEALEQMDHTVMPFSINYSKNRPTPYAKYFVKPLAGPEAIYFDEQSKSLRTILKTIERSLYSREVERAVRQMVKDTQPDVAYILHYLRKLSPALLVGLKKENIPIVVRISDFMMICPAIHFLRDGVACTDCLDQHSLRPSLRYRCVKNSLAASLINYLSTSFHRWRSYFDLIDKFVIPSKFTLDKMQEAGWPAEKLIHIPSFVNPFFLNQSPPPFEKRDRIVYAGHLEYHKGADLLVSAYAKAFEESAKKPPKLIMIAGAKGNMAEECRRIAKTLPENAIEFTGFLDQNGVREHMRKALFTVVPSRCFENMPQSVIESYASGTPVIGADHGSITPLIENDITGRYFSPGNSESLAQVLSKTWNDRDWCRIAGQKARSVAEAKYTQTTHLDKLTTVLESVIN